MDIAQADFLPLSRTVPTQLPSTAGTTIWDREMFIRQSLASQPFNERRCYASDVKKVLGKDAHEDIDAEA